MTIQEYFGDWSHIIDMAKAERLMKHLISLSQPVCPLPKDTFKAFHFCPLHNLKVIIIGQDPYPDIHRGIPTATGIAFGNSKETSEENYSPSLDVLKESVIDYTIPHGSITFDPSLEKWEKQGVLMLNSALSCFAGKPGSHALMWRPFIKTLLTNLSLYDSGIVYVLMGSDAQSFEPCINSHNNHVIRIRHPSWYARNHQKMPTSLWRDINKILIAHYGYGIEWYKEHKFINEIKTNEEVLFAGHC